MEPDQIVNILLSLVVLALFILTTVKLFLRMRNTKLKNLGWLVGFFTSSSLIGISKAAGATATGASFIIFELMFYILEFLSLAFLIMFTKETYYKNQKSGFKLVLITAIILSSSSFTFAFLRVFEYSVVSSDMFYLFDVYLMSLTIFIAAFWNASASFSSYNLIREENIDKNIKLRYRILGLTAVIFALQGFFAPLHTIIRITNPAGIYELTSTFYTFINVITQLIFAAGNFYAWITLGSKIDKTQKAKSPAVSISEEEIMKLAKAEG